MTNEIKEFVKQHEADYKITVEKYVRKHGTGEYLWLLNFKGGGFNDIWGHTLEDAIKNAREKFTSEHTQVDESSLRKATERTSREQDRMGWMMMM